MLIHTHMEPDLRTELLGIHKSGNFFQRLYREFLLSRDQTTVVAAELASMHNDGLIDLVDTFISLKHDSKAKVNFFFIREVFERALPDLTSSVLPVMECVLHLYREAGNDLLAPKIFESYVRFCERLPERPIQALQHIEQSPNAFSDLLPSTLIAGALTNAIRFTNGAIRLSEHPTADRNSSKTHSRDMGHLPVQGGSRVASTTSAAPLASAPACQW